MSNDPPKKQSVKVSIKVKVGIRVKVIVGVTIKGRVRVMVRYLLSPTLWWCIPLVLVVVVCRLGGAIQHATRHN
jgi:hypothetical protein